MKINTTNLTFHQLEEIDTYDKVNILITLFLISIICGILLYFIKQSYLISGFKSFLICMFLALIVIISSLFPKILIESLDTNNKKIFGIIIIILLASYRAISKIHRSH